MRLFGAGQDTPVLRGGMRSERGRSHQHNEDACVADIERGLFVVADGVSGNPRGDVAARVVVERLPGLLDMALGEPWPDRDDAIERAVVDLGDVVQAEARSAPELAGMATTMVMLLVADERAHVAHLGDSRAYLLRDRRLHQLTEDHSVATELARTGVISTEEAEAHPFAHSITQAIGLPQSSAPSVQNFPLITGDRLLLCTDGLTDVLADERIEAVMSGSVDPEATCDELVAIAAAAGSRDDITAVVVDWGAAS